MVDTACGLSGFIFYWRLIDCMRVRHEREQSRIYCDGCFLLVHTLVGETELVVCSFSLVFDIRPHRVLQHQIMGSNLGHVGPYRPILVCRRRGRPSILCEFLAP